MKISMLKNFANPFHRLKWLGPALLALLGAVLLFQGIARYKEKLGYKIDLTPVLMATQPLPEGHVISPTDLALTDLPKQYLPLGVLYASDAEKAVGHSVLRPIAQGELVLWSAIDVSFVPSSPARRIAPGYRSIAVPVDSASSVGKAIRAGDHVDIFTTLSLPGESRPTTFTLLQNVTVLATGQGNAEMGQSNYSTLSLMVLPGEVALVTHAAQQGDLLFALRNPEDLDTGNHLPMVAIDQVVETAFRNSIQQERNRSIEIIRAGKVSFDQ